MSDKILIVEQIKLDVRHEKKELEEALRKKLAFYEKNLDFTILKRSIDSRKKPKIFFVYTVQINNLKKIPKNADKRFVKIVEKVSYEFKVKEKFTPNKSPVIVGFGPAGMFCALMLARAGFNPIVLERGDEVSKRKEKVEKFWKENVLDEDCNVQFGEGGAGTFSDGKLNTSVGSKNGKTEYILKTFVQFGANKDILYENKPHIGTDVLYEVVKNMRKEIISLGGKILFNSRFEDFIFDENKKVVGCKYYDIENEMYKELKTDAVCIAIGHSARDTFKNLHRANMKLEQKAFAVGLRIEHPQAFINKNKYAEENVSEIDLPQAEYKLTATTSKKRGVYSFCMCPGGFVVNASSKIGGLAVNGMSYHKRDSGNANSAIIVTVSNKDFGDDIFAGMEFQEEIEKKAYSFLNGKVPIQRLVDYKENRKSQSLGTVLPKIKGAYDFYNLNEILPHFINEAIVEGIAHFNKKIAGFDEDDAILSGVETRTSSPIRMVRDENGMSNLFGVFVCGEGAGYAGGITSAAVDGIFIAEKIYEFKLGEKCHT